MRELLKIIRFRFKAPSGEWGPMTQAVWEDDRGVIRSSTWPGDLSPDEVRTRIAEEEARLG